MALKAKADFPDERQRQKKKMCGEKATDESLCGQKSFKVETFITALDEISQQFETRFEKQNTLFMQQLFLFTPSRYRPMLQIQSDDIKDKNGMMWNQTKLRMTDFSVTNS